MFGIQSITSLLVSCSPANIRLDENVLKTSWRRLDGYVRLSLTSSEDVQDVLVKTNIFVLALHLQGVFKKFSRRLQDVFETSSRRLAKTSSRHLQDVFKRFWRCLQNIVKTSSRHLQNAFKTLWKTFSRHLQDVFKIIWRRLQDVLQRYLQDVFKTYHQVKLFLLTCLWEAFNTFLRRSFPKMMIIYRGICPGSTTSDKFMVSVQNLQERQKFIKF